MKRIWFSHCGILTVSILLAAGSVPAQNGSKPPESEASKFIYADFQNQQNGRPVSKHGGMTRMNVYSRNSANHPQFRGLENANPPAPAFALDLKRDVLKKLTSITVGVHCDKCTMEKGTVVVDNIAFEK